MKQTLIDKFKPEVKNLSEAKFLQTALENLPDETIENQIDPYSHPKIFVDSQTNLVQLRYSAFPSQAIKVVFPRDAIDCRADGYICSFTYKGNKYQIN
jgi:hypothetical protein